MSTGTVAPASRVYHPLGLPAGSVRGALALVIVVLFCTFLIVPGGTEVRVPLYLHGLLALVLVFFVAHGHNISASGSREPSPWWLPRGFMRGVIVLALAAAVVWQYTKNPQLLLTRLTPLESQLSNWPYLLLALGGGFTVGRIVRRGPWRSWPPFLNFQAWLTLLAMLGLVGLVLVQAFIRPNLENVPETLDSLFVECVLSGVVAYYFGARS